MISKTGGFAAAVKAGDIATSKQLFAGARAPYETIEPIAESFGTLDPAVHDASHVVERGERIEADGPDRRAFEVVAAPNITYETRYLSDAELRGLESDGADLFYAGGGGSGKVRAVRRPKKAASGARS